MMALMETETHTVCCRIADISITLRSDDPTLPLRVHEGMTAFLVEETEADVYIEAKWGALREKEDGAPLFDSGGLWQVFAADGAYRFRFASPAFGARPYKTAAFTRDFTHGRVTLHRPYFAAARPVCPLEYPLDELVLVHRLAQGCGVEVHACGIVDEQGQGHLFLGQSGAGKTTMARLW